MDSNVRSIKRRSSSVSFSKSLMLKSFYKSSRHAPPPNLSAARSSASSAGPSVGFIIMNQDLQQAPKLTFVVPDRNRDIKYASVEDERVDDEAAKYIHAVLERFRSA